jgi:VIT1/CCC1 family predicted Fe2+/Mn2+ transporter
MGTKSRSCQEINDNKIDVMGALITSLSAYIGSLGVLFPIMAIILTQGMHAFSNYLIYGFFAIMFFGFYEGYFNQSRLKRLVKEHKDYTSEFDEITDLIERKKDLRIR